MICLSKNLSDSCINEFAKGAKLPIVETCNHDEKQDLLIRGITQAKLIKFRLESKLDFFYIDTGYYGNYPCEVNPHGYKIFHRIVKNNLQHLEIRDRPDDRFKLFKFKLEKWKDGKHILLVPPSKKTCDFYNVNYSDWINDTILEIKKYTDRPVKIRLKQSRKDRIKNTIFKDLKDAHATVTYNSIAAVESIFYGVPAITLGPSAADPVSEKSINNIENIRKCDNDLRHQWACHLAYGQYHIDEFKSGKAYKLIYE